MSAEKITRIHLGLGFTEIGISFEADDGAGGTIRQHAFLTLEDEEVAAPLWAAVQVAFGKARGELPVDMPPAAVATALRKKRDAEAEAVKALARQRASEDRLAAVAHEIKAAEARAGELVAQINAATKRKAELDAELARASRSGKV